MKKVLVFILIMSGFAVLAQAQYKPEKGNFTTELQFSLFNINAKVDYDDEVTDISTGPFSMPGLRFRYFFSEKLALRATLGFDFGHDKVVKNLDETIDNYYYYKDITTGEYTAKNRYNTFSIAPGLEYHFGKWERMSLYVGGELFLGVTTSKSTIEEKLMTLRYEMPYYYGDEYVFIETIETEKSIEAKNCKRGYDGYGNKYVQNAPLSFGVNALFGMDFYIYKGLYMGAEFGLGYTYNTYLKGSYTENSTIITTPNGGMPDIEEKSIDQKAEDKITSGNFSVRYNPMIRLGWKF
jgi:hypothetical protein